MASFQRYFMFLFKYLTYSCKISSDSFDSGVFSSCFTTVSGQYSRFLCKETIF